ncbi:6320_t:CDS:1, partial [Entrophospora sp. SA101]
IEEIKRPHISKTIDPKWFDDYPWFETESVNGNTILYCKVCRNCNWETVLARGIIFIKDR